MPYQELIDNNISSHVLVLELQKFLQTIHTCTCTCVGVCVQVHACISIAILCVRNFTQIHLPFILLYYNIVCMTVVVFHT